MDEEGDYVGRIVIAKGVYLVIPMEVELGTQGTKGPELSSQDGAAADDEGCHKSVRVMCRLVIRLRWYVRYFVRT